MTKIIIANVLWINFWTNSVFALTYFQKGLNAGFSGGYTMADPNIYQNNGAQKRKTSLSVSGNTGGGFLGYSWFLDALYINGEIFGFISKASGKLENGVDMFAPATAKVKLCNGYGFAFHLGYLFSPQLLGYLKTGIIRSKWKSTSSSSDLGYGKFSDYKIGLDLGFGVEYKMSPNLSAGLEFTHTRYQVIQYDILNNGGTVMSNVKIRPRSNLLAGRLILRPGSEINQKENG